MRFFWHLCFLSLAAGIRDHDEMEKVEDADEIMMKETYATVDANGDQKVDMKEAEEAGLTELEFKAADSNQDGSLDQKELVEAFQAMTNEEGMEDAEDEGEEGADEDEEGMEDAEDELEEGSDEDEEGMEDIEDEDEEGSYEDDDAIDDEDEILMEDFDANGDEMVDMEEATEAGLTELEFKAADTNQDGSLDLEELAEVVQALNEGSVTSEDGEMGDVEDADEIMMKDTYATVDANGDHKVDMKEAEEAGLTEVEFKAADANQDGSLDPKELVAAFQAMTNEEGMKDAEDKDEEGHSPDEEGSDEA